MTQVILASSLKRTNRTIRRTRTGAMRSELTGRGRRADEAQSQDCRDMLAATNSPPADTCPCSCNRGRANRSPLTRSRHLPTSPLPKDRKRHALSGRTFAMGWSLLFLHGVGDGFRDDSWFEAVSASLEVQGIQVPEFSSDRIIRPDYVELFTNPPRSTSGKAPDPTPKEPGSATEKQARRAAYQRRLTAAVHGLPATSTAAGWRGLAQEASAEQYVGHLPPVRDLQHASEYLRNRHLRVAVLHRVISEIGKQRDLLVVGHSLGSVVAVDLLAHLPRNVHVRRLITIGSPAGATGTFRQHPEALLRDFPYHRVGSWVNVLAPWDVVTRGLGVAHLFPAAVDVRIPGGQHAAAAYLSHPAVGKLAADPLRAPSQVTSTGAELAIPLTSTEADAVDGVLFAALVERQKGSSSSSSSRRYAQAVSAIREASAREMIDQRKANGAPTPHHFSMLAEDRLDELSFSDRPTDEALYFAVVAATNNPVAPYELDTENDQLRAVKHLWHEEYGYTQANADKVAAAIVAAKSAFGNGPWGKVLLGAAGLALLAAGPLGLALAAGSGLAGAAALTSALAAFGPGGMVGGMALAGSLVGLGSGTVATAASFPSTRSMSRDMLQTQCVRLLAFAKAHADLDLAGDRHAPWRIISQWRSDLAAEQATVIGISDDDSAGVKSLKVRIKIVDTALSWLMTEGLAPSLPTPSQD